MKLPVSILALAKLQELNVSGLDRRSAMVTDSAFYCQKRTRIDSSSAGSYPSIENFIKRMFLVSDNYAYTKVYEFVGFEYAHSRLGQWGYKNIRLFNRLDASCPGDTARITPPVYFIGSGGDTLYRQPLATFSTALTHPVKSSLAGKGFISGGKVISSPKDFSRHNYLQAKDLHRLMRHLVFNDSYEKEEQLPISESDRFFMIRQLGLFPRESEHPRYDQKIYYDTFKKYFIWGSSVARVKDDSVRVINIVGRAYGFLIDCAYITDLKNNLEFLLTAAIYVNDRDIIGTGKYGYDKQGLPFLKDASLLIYSYERNRKRERQPDLDIWRRLFAN